MMQLQRRARGLTLFETVAAIFLLAVAGAISFGAVGSALPQTISSRQPVMARELARDLLEEVTSRPFNDPSGTDTETSRASFDDIDDYAGYTDSPPVNPQGVAIPGGAGFTRTVRVIPVASGAPGGAEVPRGSATLLRVEVEVSWADGRKVLLTGLKPRVSPAVIPGPMGGLEYVRNSRTHGNGEHVHFDLINRSVAPISVGSVRVSWTPDETMYFRQVRIGSTGGDGDDDDGGTSGGVVVTRTSPYFAEGEPIALGATVTFLPSVPKHMEVNHFREQADGKKGAEHPTDNALALDFDSGSQARHVDIPVSSTSGDHDDDDGDDDDGASGGGGGDGDDDDGGDHDD